MIENKETSPEKENCEKLPNYDAPLSPIPRGEESHIVHSLGMAGKTELESSKGTEDSKSSTENPSNKYIYGTPVIHEEDCEYPFCYIKNRKKKKLSFSINAAQITRTVRNTKCSSSRPAACSAEITAIPTPMVNLKMKASRNRNSYLANIHALLDTGCRLIVWKNHMLRSTIWK